MKDYLKRKANSSMECRNNLIAKVARCLGVDHMISTFRCSIKGFWACARNETAFRQELFLGVITIVAAILLPISIVWRMYLVSLWVVLISIELVNTAIETVVDMISPEWNEKAGLAKDLGGAAVLCIVLLIVISWVVVIVNLAIA